MREAVIVSTARTPIGKAYRGAFNDLDASTMAGYAIDAAVSRAKLDPADVEDCVMGAAMQQGSTGYNIGRLAGLSGGLPRLGRQCRTSQRGDWGLGTGSGARTAAPAFPALDF